jgi:hypothetical protein
VRPRQALGPRGSALAHTSPTRAPACAATVCARAHASVHMPPRAILRSFTCTESAVAPARSTQRRHWRRRYYGCTPGYCNRARCPLRLARTRPRRLTVQTAKSTSALARPPPLRLLRMRRPLGPRRPARQAVRSAAHRKRSSSASRASRRRTTARTAEQPLAGSRAVQGRPTRGLRAARLAARARTQRRVLAAGHRRGGRAAASEAVKGRPRCCPSRGPAGTCRCGGVRPRGSTNGAGSNRRVVSPRRGVLCAHGLGPKLSHGASSTAQPCLPHPGVPRDGVRVAPPAAAAVPAPLVRPQGRLRQALPLLHQPAEGRGSPRCEQHRAASCGPYAHLFLCAALCQPALALPTRLRLTAAPLICLQASLQCPR